MPFIPPSIPWSSLQQAMEAQTHINKMMPAIEAVMRNFEAIQAGAKQLEEYHAMRPYIEEAMRAQEAFNKSKEDFAMYHEYLASMEVEPSYTPAIPPSLLLDAADIALDWRGHYRPAQTVVSRVLLRLPAEMLPHTA